ncbi:DinB family protein [Kribbella sandramycini]|uniref:DinB family protein n=1 Tax=Kribbella sandramycini TaxID=60450 RepID=A0A7Y4L049_9ACTN|nr:DinB family protein [Kribbella sandramycini]MBB6569285.1 hypothetical protein [Kribbella sandramycini]NOL40876.1 DinB family protein [Kribbella sandramycini]
MNWSQEVAQQAGVHWERQFRPRFEGMSDEEYFWEPGPGAWSVRPDAGGVLRADFAVPPPEPAPVTTIAWRLAHLNVLFELQQVLIGGPAIDWQDATPPPATAKESLDRLDGFVTAWVEGVGNLGDDGLAQATSTEGWTVASMVLHQNRELIHHGAEIALLRDLYRLK